MNVSDHLSNKDCKGCLLITNQFRRNTNGIIHIVPAHECPCRHCLMKFMCSQYCEPFLEFIIENSIKSYRKNFKIRLNYTKEKGAIKTRQDIILFLKYFKTYYSNRIKHYEWTDLIEGYEQQEE